MEDNVSDDLFLKYQKLASEYSKMRAQITVLKKAVTEEQAKNRELKDNVKEKDQSVRKLEMEIESLSFRNQQLTKRVTVLQDELTHVGGQQSDKGKKTKSNKHHTPPSNHGVNSSLDSSVFDVLDLELKNKIAENENLHGEMHNIEMECQRKINEIQQELDVLKSGNETQQKSLNESLESQRVINNKLTQEKEKCETKLHNCQRELQEAQILAENLDIQAKSLRAKVQLLEESKRLDQNSFDDNKDSSLIRLNVPSIMKSNLSNVRKFVGDFQIKFLEILHSLSNLHTYMEQRVNLSSDHVSDAAHYGLLKRFAEHLHCNAHYLRRIEESFERFHEKVLSDDMSLVMIKSNVHLLSVVENFSNYVSYISKLVPYVIMSLSIDTPIGGESGVKISEKNDKLRSCCVRCSNCFSQIETYINLLINQSMSPSNFQCAFKQLIRHLNNLHATFDDIKRAYSCKLVLEHELPTVTEKIRTTDDCMLSSVVVLVNATAEICTLVGTHYELFTGESSLYKVRGKSLTQVNLDPSVIQLKDRASKYMNNLLETHKSAPASVPYEIAIANQALIQGSTQSKENLTRQLQACESKLSDLNQAKEHWMLEAQLIQVKYERESRKVMELESRLNNGNQNQMIQQNSAATNTTSNSNTPSGSQKSVEMLATYNDLVSSIQSPSASEDKLSIGSATNAEDDTQVSLYLRKRIAQLVDNLHNCDSKCVALHAECVCLQQRLSICEKDKLMSENELTICKRTIGELKEDLSVNVKNYEGQLSMMSEHLANMNIRLIDLTDKSTAQKDEIDALKLEANNANKANSRRSRIK